MENITSSRPVTRAVFIIWTAVFTGNPAFKSSSNISTTIVLSRNARSPEPIPSDSATPFLPPGKSEVKNVSPEIFSLPFPILATPWIVWNLAPSTQATVQYSSPIIGRSPLPGTMIRPAIFPTSDASSFIATICPLDAFNVKCISYFPWAVI